MKRVSSRRAKACAISQPVRERVYSRDGWQCIFNGPKCEHNRMLTPAHVLSAAHGGMGIEQNLVTACIPCHHIFDNGTKEERKACLDKAEAHLRSIYPDFDEIEREYHKYQN